MRQCVISHTPFLNQSNGQLVQPWFDANRYEATVTPVPNGGLAIPGTVKWGFKEGGGFEFASVYLQLRGRVATGAAGPSGVRGEEEEALPLYTPEAPSPITPQQSQQRSATVPARIHVVPIPIPTEAPPEYSQPPADANPSA